MVSEAWRAYLSRLPDTLAAIPSVLNRVRLTAQEASISATSLASGTVEAGLYRATWSARITRAATTSSSLTVRLDWVDGAVACTSSGAAITGNTTATVQSGTVVLRADGASALTYQTAYASVGGTSMQYTLDLTLERLGP
jgi:hypothetical protein